MSNKEKAFLEAFDKYADDIFRHCYFRVYNKETAEDLMQETFTKTWQYIAQGKEIKNIRAFLYKVAINLIIDNSRKKKEIKELDANIRPYYIEDKLFNKFQVGEIIKILDELTESQRQVITMRYINELMPAEIAKILGESANAVSVRISQGMSKLREIINKKYERKRV